MKRRSFLTAGVSGIAALAGCSDAPATRHGWVSARTDIDGSLADVVMSTSGPYAVGDGGTVVRRKGDKWKTVATNGPNQASNDLTAAAVSSDGLHVWFCGSSGALGRYHTGHDQLKDYSAPDGKTSTWEAVSVLGPATRERLLIANSSGELLAAQFDGDQGTWGQVRKPTAGDSITALTAATNRVFVASNSSIYRRQTNGWKQLNTPNAGTIQDLAVLKAGAEAVTDSGKILVYNGQNWLRVSVSPAPLAAIDRSGNRGLTVGDSGTIRTLEDGEWRSDDADAKTALRGVALGTERYSDVAVGDGGVILERFQ